MEHLFMTETETAFLVQEDGEINWTFCYCDDKANAKRIVSCVNALAGIEDVEGFTDKLNTLLDEYSECLSEGYPSECVKIMAKIRSILNGNT